MRRVGRGTQNSITQGEEGVGRGTLKSITQGEEEGGREGNSELY